MGSKTCSRCGELKSLAEFGKCKKNRDGLQGWCKECRNAYYRERNPESNRAAGRRWYERNRTFKLQRVKDWQTNNAEHRAKYLEANRQRFRDYGKAYYEDNREHVLTRSRINHLRKQVGGGAENDCYLSLLTHDVCAYCGAPDDITLDHITPVSAGGARSVDNVTAACFRCNRRKADKPLLRFLWEAA